MIMFDEFGEGEDKRNESLIKLFWLIRLLLLLETGGSDGGGGI